MKQSRVLVPWRAGLHLRAAARLVRVAQRFKSSISLKFSGQSADLRSVLSVVALCATMGVALDLEAVGDDEQSAILAVEQMFVPDDDDIDADPAMAMRAKSFAADQKSTQTQEDLQS